MHDISAGSPVLELDPDGTLVNKPIISNINIKLASTHGAVAVAQLLAHRHHDRALGQRLLKLQQSAPFARIQLSMHLPSGYFHLLHGLVGTLSLVFLHAMLEMMFFVGLQCLVGLEVLAALFAAQGETVSEIVQQLQGFLLLGGGFFGDFFRPGLGFSVFVHFYSLVRLKSHLPRRRGSVVQGFQQVGLGQWCYLGLGLQNLMYNMRMKHHILFKVVLQELPGLLPEVLFQINAQCVVNLNPKLVDELVSEDGSPNFPEDFELLLDALAAVGDGLPVAFGEHAHEAGREGEGQLDEPVQEVDVAEQLRMIQIGVEITLNQRGDKIIKAEVRVRGHVLSELAWLDGIGAAQVVLAALQVHLGFVVHFYIIIINLFVMFSYIHAPVASWAARQFRC